MNSTLYLLRVRRGDPRAFDPTSRKDLALFLEAKKLMAEAGRHAENRNDFRRAKGIEQVTLGLDKYLRGR